jgi:FtsP/CotA-like multicopper oxidase with cupredoxin domain
MKRKPETTYAIKRRKLMHNMKVKGGIALVLLFAVVGLTPATIPAAQASAPDQSLDLPSPLCDSVQVPEGNSLAFRVYALGVQVYKWNGASWGFVAPEATLFADSNYHGEVGIHYAGPTWESNSGSKVVATRVAGCTPDPTAIPWLRLQTVSTEGSGIFTSVTFIQRVNTTGGLAPTAPGSATGEVAAVPYTAEYYFYRARD